VSGAVQEIVGRDAELGVLESFASGRLPDPVLVFVEGEAGVGKTAVWSAALEAARANGARVLVARPAPVEAMTSFSALGDLVRPVADALAQVNGPARRALRSALLLEDADVPFEPRLVGLGFLSLLEAVAAEGTVMVAVDDWQWLDRPSADALRFVVRRLSPGAIRVLATVRTGDADDAVAALIRSVIEGRVLELPLAPLDPSAVARIVRARAGGSISPPALARVCEAASGNALTALELARSLDGSRPSEASEVRRLMATRVAGLPRNAREVLRCVAAVPVGTMATVAAALDDVSAAREGVEAALLAEVVQRDGDRLRLAHPLFAMVAESCTSAEDWRALHRRLAALTDDVEERARHLAIATTAPDHDVAQALEAAATQAATRGAPAAAGELAERAGELTPADEPEARGARLLAAATAHGRAGDGARAARILTGLIDELPPGPQRATAMARLAGNGADGVELARRALAEAGDEPAVRAEAHAILALALSFAGTAFAEGWHHAEAAVAQARVAGDAGVEALALTMLAMYRLFHGGEGVQREALVRAARLERRSTSAWTESVFPLAYLGLQLCQTGELDLARAVLGAELKRGARSGDLGQQAFCLDMLADVEVRAGRFEMADAHAQQSLALGLGPELGNAQAVAHWAIAKVRAHRGRAAEAREHAMRSIALSRDAQDGIWAAFATAVLGFLELSLGEPAAAVTALAPLGPRALGRDPEITMSAPDLVEALVLLGDVDRAADVQRDLEAWGRRARRPWAISAGLRCRGLVEATQGAFADAVNHHREALATLEGSSRPFEQARTLLAQGVAERRAKRRADARTSLETAYRQFAAVGAPLWAERALTEIDRLGGRRARNRDQLTPTEQRIAAEAAAGRSNREIAATLFVSERTVESNLTRVYRKIGVRSRTELARRLPDG
jgi:DNA-binding CsgD family transcriptional regulator